MTNRLDSLIADAAQNRKSPPKRSPSRRRLSKVDAGNGSHSDSPKRRQRTDASRRKRGRKSYPVVGLGDVISLAEGIMTHNQGQPVKRETLLKTMGLEPGSQSTRNLIINSNKYQLTEGGYKGETLRLTTKGFNAVNPKAKTVDRLRARFELAIEDVSEFSTVFEKRKGNNMPAPEMLHDDLQGVDIGDRKSCADVFISNVRFLGMLVDREGAQYLMTVEEWLSGSASGLSVASISATTLGKGDNQAGIDASFTDFDKVCFVLSTINDPGSDERKHADMILSQYIERALEGTGLRIVRADKIGDPGMISKQIIEHIVFSKLVVADLSFHNPNVFYELSLRHVTGKPTVHIIQQSDRIPFDIGNFRTIKIDTNDKYKMVSELDTLRAEIATSIKQTLANGESRDNPILTFCPSATFAVSA